MRRLAVLLLVPVLALGAGCGGDDDDDVSASSGFCDRARLLDRQMTTLEEQFGGEEMPSSEAFEETADAIGSLAAGAPSAIKGDLETLEDGVREIADIFGDIDLTDPASLTDPDNVEQLEEMGERMEALDEEIGEASERIETYLSDECDLDISDGDDGDDDDGDDGDGTDELEDGTEGS